MSDTPAVAPPFTSFNFRVEIQLPGSAAPLCEAAFAECDGVEMSMDVKTIREGGDNARQVRLTGAMTFGNLSLKRGLTSSFDLWTWMAGYGRTATMRRRAEVRVVLLAADGTTERCRWVLTGGVPIKLKAPSLNAKDGQIAIEELQIAYETIELRPGGS
jgi:phage tail-like protein